MTIVSLSNFVVPKDISSTLILSSALSIKILRLPSSSYDDSMLNGNLLSFVILSSARQIPGGICEYGFATSTQEEIIHEAISMINPTKTLALFCALNMILFCLLTREVIFFVFKQYIECGQTTVDPCDVLLKIYLFFI